MGVNRLYTFIKKNKISLSRSREESEGGGGLVEYVDLVNVAANRPGGISLIVDFYSWEHFMNDNFKVSLDKKTKNSYLYLYGGEYKAAKDYIESFVKALRHINIELVFYMDGAKGSSDQATREKWNTWVIRQSADVVTATKILNFFNHQEGFNEINPREVIRPCLQEVQNIITLQRLGCEICPCVTGEADSFIARRVTEDEKAYVVFTNDTDFCIFPDCGFLTSQFFDIERDLCLGDESLEVAVPTKLICGIVRSESLYKYLYLPSPESLFELAVMAGNDFTLPILNEIPTWQSYVGNIRGCVSLIQQFGSAEQCPRFAQMMHLHPALLTAVQHSKQFYSSCLSHEDDGHDEDQILFAISQGVKSSKLPGSLFSMHRSFYWHRMLVEDVQQSQNTAERSMVHLRGHIYALLLPPDIHHVYEYGRTPENGFQQMTAKKVTYTPLPPLTVISRNSFQKNRIIFHNIMSHLEYSIPPFDNSYFKSYGNKLGFSCYLLRYFLLLNWQQNLFLHEGEFLTICAWVLGQHDPEKYYEYTVIPTGRCVTIESWLLCLYRTSYAYLGSLLGITDEFSIPAECFSGAVWVSLYTASHLVPRGSLAKREIPVAHAKHVVSTIKKVLYDKRHVIEKIVDGVFQM